MRGRLLVPLLLCLACSSSAPRRTQTGLASWYGPGFHGRLTASGEIFDMEARSAAHRTLPLGSLVEVRNLENGRSIVVRINDRGPWIRGRILDLSLAAARDLGMVEAGLARVRIRVLDRDNRHAPPSSWVQVGAFHRRANARALAATLRARHPTTSIRSEGEWFRVQILHHGDRDDLENLLEELQREGYEPFVISEPELTSRDRRRASP